MGNEVEGRSIGADEWSLMLAWSVLASWRDMRQAARQHLTLVKRRADGKTITYLHEQI
jgi:hypothetical protein